MSVLVIRLAQRSFVGSQRARRRSRCRHGCIRPGSCSGRGRLELDDTVCHTLVRDVIPKNKLEELLGNSGIDNDTVVVLSGDNNNWFAAWAFWQLKLLGHEDIAVHGRRPKEMAGGRKGAQHRLAECIQRKPTKPKTRTTRCAPSSPKCRRPWKKKSAALVDVRSPAEFTGEILAPPGLPNVPAGRSHPRREEHALGQAGQRRRHVQEPG